MKRIMLLTLSALLLFTACSAALPSSSLPKENSSSPLPSSSDPSKINNKTLSLSSPVFPKTSSDSSSYSVSDEFMTALRSFSADSASLILGSADKSKNSVYSPVSLYMALAMLSEAVDGETLDELLAALHVSDRISLRGNIKALFSSLFFDNEIGSLKLANSIWLSNSVPFKQACLEILSSDYFAYSFSSDFSSPKTSADISKWIYDSTNGKLGGDPSSFQTDPNEIARIINAIYFYDRWKSVFQPEYTYDDDFTLADGSILKTPFMHQSLSLGNFADTGTALVSSLSFENAGKMIFILPNEGISPYDIINDSEKFSDALSSLNGTDVKRGRVIFSVPKFDFSSKTELSDIIKTLGAGRIFSPNQSDFSNLTDIEAFVSGVMQEAAISIDENGCEAAAYTQIMMATTALVSEQCIMDLDRPFIFAVEQDGAILFTGVVNNPAA